MRAADAGKWREGPWQRREVPTQAKSMTRISRALQKVVVEEDEEEEEAIKNAKIFLGWKEEGGKRNLERGRHLTWLNWTRLWVCFSGVP